VSQSRIEQFQAFLDQDPNNTFARYVIAQEHTKAGALDEAVAAYRELLNRDPDYVAAYYHGGKTLEQLDDNAAANTLYTQGIEVANRVGNAHARAELEEALSAVS